MMVEVLDRLLASASCPSMALPLNQHRHHLILRMVRLCWVPHFGLCWARCWAADAGPMLGGCWARCCARCWARCWARCCDAGPDARADSGALCWWH